MKTVLVILAILFANFAQADQRIETVGGFCHFVLNAANDDNEVFFANCQNSIVQNNDGTGDGTAYVEIEYPFGTTPVITTVKFTGIDTGISCVMVDSNGVTYVTQDWNSTYQFRHGMISAITKTYPQMPKVVYSIECRNGQQQ